MTATIPGSFVWHEHMTKDVKGAIAFYTEVIGWKTQPFGDSGDYTMWATANGPMGGVMPLPEQAAAMGAPPMWMGNVMVTDVDRTAALCTELGGKVYQAPFDVPTVGRAAVIADPQGASLGLFQPANTMEARDPSQEGEFCWNELMTSDSAKAMEFYARMFGWQQVHEMDMGPMGLYRIFGIGDRQLGGMMTAPADHKMPPMWLHYTETRDLTAAIARATSRGGKLLIGPMPVPNGGQFAQLTDPQGAVFALHQAPAK